jgi:hypothetical protein
MRDVRAGRQLGLAVVNKRLDCRRGIPGPVGRAEESAGGASHHAPLPTGKKLAVGTAPTLRRGFVLPAVPVGQIGEAQGRARGVRRGEPHRVHVKELSRSRLLGHIAAARKRAARDPWLTS